MKELPYLKPKTRLINKAALTTHLKNGRSDEFIVKDLYVRGVGCFLMSLDETQRLPGYGTIPCGDVMNVISTLKGDGVEVEKESENKVRLMVDGEAVTFELSVLDNGSAFLRFSDGLGGEEIGTTLCGYRPEYIASRIVELPAVCRHCRQEWEHLKKECDVYNKKRAIAGMGIENVVESEIAAGGLDYVLNKKPNLVQLKVRLEHNRYVDIHIPYEKSAEIMPTILPLVKEIKQVVDKVPYYLTVKRYAGTDWTLGLDDEESDATALD